MSLLLLLLLYLVLVEHTLSDFLVIDQTPAKVLLDSEVESEHIQGGPQNGCDRDRSLA